VISFIIPAHDEEVLLPATLSAIRAAATEVLDRWEVIVVDDASADATARIAAERGARVVSISRRQISASRNAGAGVAEGDVFVFVDADTIVSVPVLREMVDALRGGVCGGGCAIRFEGVVPFYGRVMEEAGFILYPLLGLASGAFLFCTREAFQKVGGFSEELFAAEEARMSRALRSHGRFVVLRTRVLTSGRKLRTYSAREVLGTLLRILVGGKKALRTRAGLGLWYERRPDDK